MKLKYFTILLCLLCVVLIYRIVDLAVTIDYVSHNLNDALKDLKTIKEFQGKKCSAALDKVDGVTIFQKGNLIIIREVSFNCKLPENYLYAIE